VQFRPIAGADTRQRPTPRAIGPFRGPVALDDDGWNRFALRPASNPALGRRLERVCPDCVDTSGCAEMRMASDAIGQDDRILASYSRSGCVDVLMSECKSENYENEEDLPHVGWNSWIAGWKNREPCTGRARIYATCPLAPRSRRHARR